MLHLGRPFWPHLSAVFVLDQFTWVLILASPLPVAMVLNVVTDKPPLPQWLMPLVSPEWDKLTFILIAVVMQLTLAILAMSQDALRHIMCTFTGEKLTLEFRSRLFRHAQRLSLSFHDARGTSDSIYRIQYDTQSIQWIMIYGVGPFCSAIVSLLAMFTVLWLISWKLALVALAVTPMLVLIPRFFKGLGAQRYREVKEQEADALKVVQEVLTAIRVVKAFGREDDEQDRFLNRSRSTVRAKLRLATAESGLAGSIKFTTALGAAVVLYFCAKDILTGSLTAGHLWMVMSYTAQLYSPLEQITRKIADIQWSLVSVDRAFELLDEKPDVPQKANAQPLTRARGEVVLRDVSFAYAGDKDNPILRGANVNIQPGQRIGIVGKTGAGKSTLVSLLMRFYDPVSGDVMIDGLDVRDYKLEDLRNQFAIVLQEPVLFSSSIAENIAYSKPGATMQQIIDAAKAAHADEFIRQFPQGYETQVGERGMRLSGGERQRISLARAFLKDAPLLIMDEPTSSVDVQTEARIMEAMNRLMQGRTCFLITHRPSTLRYCDRVIAVEYGQLVEKSVEQAMNVVAMESET